MWFRIPEKQNLTVNRKNTGIHCQQLGLTQLIKGENFVLFSSIEDVPGVLAGQMQPAEYVWETV